MVVRIVEHMLPRFLINERTLTNLELSKKYFGITINNHCHIQTTIREIDQCTTNFFHSATYDMIHLYLSSLCYSSDVKIFCDCINDYTYSSTKVPKCYNLDNRMINHENYQSSGQPYFNTHFFCQLNIYPQKEDQHKQNMQKLGDVNAELLNVFVFSLTAPMTQ